MKITFYLLILSLFCCFSCTSSNSQSKVTELNLELSKEIDKMANADQQMQINMLTFFNAPEELEQVKKTRDQVYALNAKRAQEILTQYGYPDYNLVGKKSSDNFYTILSHASAFPEIKKDAIKKMKNSIKMDNFQIDQYANLVDMTAFENKEPLIYGNIVKFKSNGQAYVENLVDSIHVDQRRVEIGLDSLKQYMNYKTLEYFRANQQELVKRGITRPSFYN
ncbi:hypothetical protein N9B82_04865 [Saprospiraceae bacterium]|nr:hypothetical protein [Saprospiraceae bacterium]